MIEFKTELLPHQKQAVEKLIGIRVGALYMEMGTGKTRTALEMIQRRYAAGKIDRVLWLCPCSVRTNLVTDIKYHCGELPDIIRISGIESLSGSERLYAEHMAYVTDKTMLIVDESNLVKNSRAIRSVRITSIAEQCRYRLILNGTPISRNEADLYGQWYLLDWRILGYRSFWAFAANHLEYDERYRGKVRRVLNVDYLTDKISPYTYSIRKDECISLPPKIYSTRYFNMTPNQSQHYDAQCDAFLATLIDADDSTAIYRTFTALQEIASGRKIISDAIDPIKHEPYFDSPSLNPRMQALLDLLDGADEQYVIWTKFQHEVDDILAILPSSVEFTGSLAQKKRQSNLEVFRTGGAQFLVANKSCAGYGLNLQYCNKMIYYNNDWDWATRAQSEDRLHRLGQSNIVYITDIAASATIDLRILQNLNRKTNMVERFKSSIRSKNASAWLKGIDVGGDGNDSVGIDKSGKGGVCKKIPSRKPRDNKRGGNKPA